MPGSEADCFTQLTFSSSPQWLLFRAADPAGKKARTTMPLGDSFFFYLTSHVHHVLLITWSFYLPGVLGVEK